METIKKILFYPEVEPEVRILSSKDSFEQNNQYGYMKGKSENNKNNKNKKNKKNNGNRDEKKNSDGLTYSPFFDLPFELPE